MRLTIISSDLNSIRKVCVTHSLKCYAVPTSRPALLEVSVRRDDGGEISTALAFCIGREVEAQRDLELADKRIQEHEMLQPQPNNVLIHVEPYVDELP